MTQKPTDHQFVLDRVDKLSRKHKDGCPASQIPLACATTVQSLVSDGTLEIVQGGRNGTAMFLRRT